MIGLALEQTVHSLLSSVAIWRNRMTLLASKGAAKVDIRIKVYLMSPSALHAIIVLPAHAVDHLSLCRAVPVGLAERWNTWRIY
jgi:hypothetical protein